MQYFCMKLVQHNENQVSTVETDDLWPILVTWFNFNPSMDEQSHA